MKRRRVVLLPEAQADPRWIYDTIERATSSATAMRYIERLEAFCRDLDLARNAAPSAPTCWKVSGSSVFGGA